MHVRIPLHMYISTQTPKCVLLLGSNRTRCRHKVLYTETAQKSDNLKHGHMMDHLNDPATFLASLTFTLRPTDAYNESEIDLFSTHLNLDLHPIKLDSLR